MFVFVISVAALAFYLFHLLFFPLFETTDSYFFYAFGQFIRTGTYFVPPPYNWPLPSTIVPPIYSLFLAAVQFFPRADIAVHLFHIAALFSSSYIIFVLLLKYVNKYLALIIAFLFLLLPANMIQTSSLMSETFALASLSVYLLLAYKILSEKKENLINHLLIFSAFAVLLRYNFISLYGLVLLLFVFFIKRKTGRNIVFITLSILILTGWILVNHKLNGSWGFSDQQGKNLYNRVIGSDKLTPPENDASWTYLKSLSGSGTNLNRPVWEIEPVILPLLEMDLARESRLLAAVALGAVKKNPAAYLSNTVRNFFIVHGQGPRGPDGFIFPYDVYTYGPWMGEKCRTLGAISFCRPLFNNDFAMESWNRLVGFAQWYHFSTPIFTNFLLLFPALFYSLVQKNNFIRFLGTVYLISVFTVLLVEMPVYRYLYPLYPVKTILVVYMISRLNSFAKYPKKRHPVD